MELIPELFVGGSVKDVSTIVYSLKRDIPVQGLYCICLFLDGNTHMELMSSHEICNKRYARRKFKVAGIAYGKAQVHDLFMFIIDTAVKNGRNLNRPDEWIR